MHNAQLNGRERNGQTGYGLSPNDRSNETRGNENLLPMGSPIRAVWRRWWIVAVLVIVAVVSTAVVTPYMQTPTYTSSVKILIGQAEPEIEDSEFLQTPNLFTQIQGLREITLTMAEGVKTRPVAEAAAQELDFPLKPAAIRGNLQAKRIGETQFIEVTYEDASPERSQQVVNAVSDAFSEQASQISPSESSIITATVWERAGTGGSGSTKSGDPVLRNVMFALALSLILGVALAVLLDYLSDRCRSPEEAEQISGVPSFGSIPPVKHKKGIS